MRPFSLIHDPNQPCTAISQITSTMSNDPTSLAVLSVCSHKSHPLDSTEIWKQLNLPFFFCPTELSLIACSPVLSLNALFPIQKITIVPHSTFLGSSLSCRICIIMLC
ncbi:hypothetical protein BDR07DRAFT_1422395, partial [Suillus spraguei]